MYNVMYMARKIRTQIYLDPEQDKMLRERAGELGISKAELIRRLIAQATGSYEPTGVAAGSIAEPAAPYQAGRRHQIDKQAWEESKKLIKERMKLKVPRTPRTWTRDDLYEERFARVSHRQ